MSEDVTTRKMAYTLLMNSEFFEKVRVSSKEEIEEQASELIEMLKKRQIKIGDAVAVLYTALFKVLCAYVKKIIDEEVKE